MDTLLCRRFELARCSGIALGDADVAIADHLGSCDRCQDAMALDRMAEEVLTRQSQPMPGSARRRVEALIAIKAREEAPWSDPGLMAGFAAAMATAALVALVVVRVAAPRAAVAEPSYAQVVVPPDDPVSVVTLEQEPIVGLSRLVSHHTSGALVSPDAAVIHQSKLPFALANQLVSASESAHTATYDGMPTAQSVHDATLFVLDRAMVLVDPALEEVLEEIGALTLPEGPHQVTLAVRGDRLFVIVADPAPPATLAGGPL